MVPSRLPKSDRLTTDDGNTAWYDYKANQIVVRWAPEKFTNSSSAMVDISLLGYRETTDQVSGRIKAYSVNELLWFDKRIQPLLGHCIATWYAMARYLVKLTELETSWGRGDTVTY